MTSDDMPPPVERIDSLPCFLASSDWQYIVHALRFSPQQAKIVSLILQKKQDKEISAKLGLNRSTIRTYLRRVFDRVGVEDRMELVLHVFALCLRRRDEPRVSLLKSDPGAPSFSGPSLRRAKRRIVDIVARRAGPLSAVIRGDS